MHANAIGHVLVGATAVATLAGGVGSALAAPAAQHTTLSISTPATGSSKTAPLRYAKTGSGGTVTFSVTPPQGKDEYALVYNGSPKTHPSYDGSHSKTVTVTVSK